MIYEIRVKSYMKVGSKSLNEFYRNKEKAQKYVDELNTILNLYYINEIKLKDEED